MGKEGTEIAAKICVKKRKKKRPEEYEDRITGAGLISCGHWKRGKKKKLYRTNRRRKRLPQACGEGKEKLFPFKQVVNQLIAKPPQSEGKAIFFRVKRGGEVQLSKM